MFDQRNNHKPVWKMGACYPLIILRWESLFSCWNSLQLGLYRSPAGVWNLKFHLPNLQLLEGSVSCCSKTSSLKTVYFKLSLFHIDLLHHGKQGSWGSCLLLWASWTIVLVLLVNRFCPSLLLRMFPSWSRMKQAKLLLVSLLLTEEVACGLS